MRGAAAATAILAAGCAATSLAPISGPGVRLEDDESTVWSLASEAQEHIDRSGSLFEEPELDAYLAEVARRLQPPEVLQAIPFRVRVVKNFRMNAFCLPNGAVYLHTGILARMESEAELAVLLAHEMTHATRRHGIRAQRKLANTASASAVLTAMSGVPVRSTVLLTAVTGYSRELEAEADEVGLALVAAAGYDLSDATKLFERLRDWSASEKKPDRPLFYETHPRIADRIAGYQTLLDTTYKDRRGGLRNQEVFGRRTARLVLENARLDLAAGRFDAAERQAQKMVAGGRDDAAVHALFGELGRQKGDLGTASAHYRAALDREPANVEAWRGLGLVLRKAGKHAEARPSFRRYLELAPHAPDRAFVEQYLELPEGGKP